MNSSSSSSSSSAAAVVTDEVVEDGLRLLQPKLEDRLQNLLMALSDTIRVHLWSNFYSNNPMEGVRTIQKGCLEKCLLCVPTRAVRPLISCAFSSWPITRIWIKSYNSVNTICTTILVYARTATQMEDHMMRQSTNSSANNGGDSPVIQYGPFSLIIMNGVVPDQLPRVDVLPPDFQFGLIVTDNLPPTRVYRSNRPVVQTTKHYTCIIVIPPSTYIIWNGKG
jgi:hypothetical protein